MKSASKQNITILSNEDAEISSPSSTGFSNPQRIILSVGICLSIVFLAWAFIAQSTNFPETTFELLIFSALVFGLMTGILFLFWRKG